MPRIRPESDLQRCYDEISSYCHDKKEPVFITKNGHGDLAVMSMEVYELLVQSMDIFRLDRLLHEGRITEVGDTMHRMSVQEGSRSQDRDRSYSAAAHVEVSKGNVHEMSPQKNQGEGSQPGESESSGGSGAREFLFRGTMAQSRQEVPASIQKIRQDFVKPQE
ncbi:MAG: hypothetical protein FWG14_04560 [Peptococcaceae bacterium]|nr:hypothetical protein [Peptococcaceae bacterium]